MPGMRLRYGSGGMFMIDMQGSLALATASSSSRTPGERYCGSCMASATRWCSEGLTPAVPPADILPGSFFELISTSPSRPLTGMRTIAPSLLIRSASAGRQIRCTACPASASLVPNSEPYEAPMIRILYLVPMNQLLLFSGDAHRVSQRRDGSQFAAVEQS